MKTGDKPPLTSSHASEMPERGNVERLLEKYNWQLFFAHFPNFEDGKVYRIYHSRDSLHNDLIGTGKTPEEAINSALSATASPDQSPTGEPKP